MNHETSQGPDANLDRLVREWRVEDPLPAGFHRGVWRRIAAVSAARAVSPAQLLRGWLARQFVRPAWSIGYAVLLLGVGLLTGYWQATAQTARWDHLMASRYVQSIDPYLQVGAQR
jgi:hypothetical protein